MTHWRGWGVGLALFGLVSFAVEARAQQALSEFDFGSSPNVVGSGARALGWGNAFIAVADDATAASWNPAGLIALERPESSLVLSYKNRSEFFEGVGISDDNDLQQVNDVDVNYVSVAYPFKIGSRFFVAALNYQELIDFEKDVRRTFFGQGTGLALENDVVFRQRGTLRAISPALSFQLSPQVSLGFTLTTLTDKLGYNNGWVQRESISQTALVGTNTELNSLDIRTRYGFNGAGGSAGVLWDITPRWTLGAVFKSPIRGKLSRKQVSFIENGVETEGGTFNEKLRLPPSYGVGVAYRYSDALSVSADIFRTEWGVFKQERTDDAGNRTSINPVSGESFGSSDVPGTTQIHAGGEYLFIFPRSVVPVRGGVFYDPEPAPGKNNHFLGLALGSGVSIFDDLIIDVAYQFRFGLDPDPDFINPGGGGDFRFAQAGSGNVWQHQFYLSAIYHMNFGVGQ